MPADRKSKKLRGDASVFIAVNVPASNPKEYEAHANRTVRLLRNAGYETNAMTGEFILRMADNIRSELARAEAMEAHLAAVAAASTEQTDDRTDNGT